VARGKIANLYATAKVIQAHSLVKSLTVGALESLEIPDPTRKAIWLPAMVF
jgi:hypothetical protein